LAALRAERDRLAVERFQEIVDALAFARVQIPTKELDIVCDSIGATRSDLLAAVQRARDRADAHEQFNRQAEELQNIATWRRW
jgi:hypothetical protein